MGTRNYTDHVKNKSEIFHGVFSWDIVENIVRGDRVFAELYGLDPDVADSGVPIETLLERISPEDVGRIARYTHQSIVAGVPFDQSFSIRRPGSDTIRVKVYSNCFHKVGGMLTHCAGSIYRTDVIAAVTGVAETRADNVLNVFSHPRKSNRSNNSMIIAPALPKPN